MDHSDPVLRAHHADHARHDLTLIAGHAARDLAGPDRLRAETLLAACAECTDLHRDLILIQTATRADPAPATRRRDFRLTEDQAASLRRGSWVRAILRPFAGARSSTRPLATAFTSVGVAGLLIATFVPGLLGFAASAPGGRELSAGAGSTGGGTMAAAAPTAAPAGIPDEHPPARASGVAPAIEVQSFGPDDPDKVTAFSFGPNATDSIAVAAGDPDLQSENTDAAGPERTAQRLGAVSPSTNLLLIGSIGFLAVGLALFVLRFAARRVR